MATGENGKKVFLSYARQDRGRVEPLVHAIEAGGHRVWWDKRLAGGAAFSSEIEQELHGADVVVVAWSAESVGSDWVRDEAAVGRDKGRLVPVSLDGTAPPLGFRQYHTVDLSGWDGRQPAPEMADLFAGIAGAEAAAAEERSRRPRMRKPPREKTRTPILSLKGLAILMGLAIPLVAVLQGNPARQPPAEQTPPPSIRAGAITLGSEVPAAFGTALGDGLSGALGSDDGTKATKGAYRLVGAAQQAGDRIAVYFRLESTQDGRMLWSGALARPAADAAGAGRDAAARAAELMRCVMAEASNDGARQVARAATDCAEEQEWGEDAGTDVPALPAPPEPPAPPER